MPLPFFLGALFGKAVVGAVSKSVVAKSGAVGAKALMGHHAHHRLAQHVAGRLAEKVVNSGVGAAFSRKREKDEKR